jgi:hypothetical protein
VLCDALAQIHRSCPTHEEDEAMKEDIVVVSGILVAAAMCAWYVAQAVAGIVHPIPTEDACSTAAQCLAVVLSQ